MACEKAATTRSRGAVVGVRATDTHTCVRSYFCAAPDGEVSFDTKNVILMIVREDMSNHQSPPTAPLFLSVPFGDQTTTQTHNLNN
jgi:hypothetical protein